MYTWLDVSNGVKDMAAQDESGRSINVAFLNSALELSGILASIKIPYNPAPWQIMSDGEKKPFRDFAAFINQWTVRIKGGSITWKMPSGEAYSLENSETLKRLSPAIVDCAGLGLIENWIPLKS